MPEKLVIRVVNAQSLKSGEEPKKPKEIVIYHWNRIFAALFVLVILLIGLVWGVMHVFNRPEATPPSAEAAAENTQTLAAAPHSASPMPSANQDAASKPGEKPAPVSPSGPKVVAAHATKTEVALFSSGIKRAQLTNGIVNGEPVDQLDQTIAMNDQGLLRVYLFMETADLKGKVLFHDWNWKGRRIAHARMPIKSNGQKAVSSKFIDRIMTGPWEVKIVDESDRVLAKAGFEVR